MLERNTDGIELNVAEREAAPSKVFADRERVLEILSNLVGNALKFTPPGGEIRVTAEPQDGYVVFKVTDNGPGIEPDQLPHVFERHWQSRRQRGSLGLGKRASRHLDLGASARQCSPRRKWADPFIVRIVISGS